MSEPPPPNVQRRRRVVRAAVIAALVVLIGVVAWSVDLEPNLSHLEVGVVSGAEEGHYHAQVARFAQRASRDGGEVRNVSTAGSVENLARLAGPESCDVDFGLVQDGTEFDDVEGVEMIARLPDAETFFFLGRDADLIEDFRDLEGLEIGVGPEGSGTAQLAQRLFALPGFDTLEVQLAHAPVSEQLEQAANGELDLAALVIFEDAQLIDRAVRSRGLQIASFASAGAVQRRLGSGVRAAVLAPGHYDAVRTIPGRERHVLQVETLLLASECASRSEINAVLSVLAHELPGFVELNRRAVPPHGLERSGVATEYFENHGPPLLDQYLPAVVDVVPLGNLMTFIMAISVLFNVMGVLNRFQIWRIDTERVKLEGELRELFGSISRSEIEHLDPDEALTSEEEQKLFADLIARQRALIDKCRRQGGSFLVPMGGEMVYRYQEDLMDETLAVMRRFQRRMEGAS